MTHHDIFLADILANPADDTPRLIYADWLMEHGEPERGEYIIVQCELARTPEKIRALRPVAKAQRKSNIWGGGLPPPGYQPTRAVLAQCGIVVGDGERTTQVENR